MGDYSSCGINTLKVCPTKELLCVSRMVQWQQYAKVIIGHKDNGDDQKMMQVQYMDTPTFELLDYLRPRLKECFTHNFVAKWRRTRCNTPYPYKHFILVYTSIGIYVHLVKAIILFLHSYSLLAIIWFFNIEQSFCNPWLTWSLGPILE